MSHIISVEVASSDEDLKPKARIIVKDPSRGQFSIVDIKEFYPDEYSFSSVYLDHIVENYPSASIIDEDDKYVETHALSNSEVLQIMFEKKYSELLKKWAGEYYEM